MATQIYSAKNDTHYTLVDITKKYFRESEFNIACEIARYRKLHSPVANLSNILEDLMFLTHAKAETLAFIASNFVDNHGSGLLTSFSHKDQNGEIVYILNDIHTRNKFIDENVYNAALTMGEFAVQHKIQAIKIIRELLNGVSMYFFSLKEVLDAVDLANEKTIEKRTAKK